MPAVWSLFILKKISDTIDQRGIGDFMIRFTQPFQVGFFVVDVGDNSDDPVAVGVGYDRLRNIPAQLPGYRRLGNGIRQNGQITHLYGKNPIFSFR